MPSLPVVKKNLPFPFVSAVKTGVMACVRWKEHAEQRLTLVTCKNTRRLGWEGSTGETDALLQRTQRNGDKSSSVTATLFISAPLSEARKLFFCKGPGSKYPGLCGSDGPATVAWKGLYSIQKLMSALVFNSPFYNEELRFGFHVTFTYRKALFFYRYFSTL